MTEPNRYRGNGLISCSQAMFSMTTDVNLPISIMWWWCCAFKYIWRWPWKNKLEDIDKAIDCLERVKAEYVIMTKASGTGAIDK